MLQDIDNEIFKLTIGSPAIAAGMFFDNPDADFYQTVFANPPSIGAIAGSPEASTNDLSSALTFRVYPNPNEGIFQIEGKQAASITIFSSHLEKIESITVEKFPFSMNLSHLPSGVYFIKIIGKDSNVHEMHLMIIQ